MNKPGTSGPEKARTRRSVIRIGAILASAVAAEVAAIVPSAANQGSGQGVQGIIGWLLSLLFGQGQNGSGQNGQGQNHTCFLRGTSIRVVGGDRKVEDLAVGDMLPTLSGGERPIQWITRHPFGKSDPSRPWMKTVRPVRVARSALAPNVPRTDLYLSEWHALFVDGVLIPVGSLINGATIRRLDDSECAELEYFNIKLESHDVIFAEGAPVETLLEVDESASNFAEYFRRYGVPTTRAVRCAPMAPYGGRGELSSRFRSAISPWLDRRDPVDVIRDRLEDRNELPARRTRARRLTLEQDAFRSNRILLQIPLTSRDSSQKNRSRFFASRSKL